MAASVDSRKGSPQAIMATAVNAQREPAPLSLGQRDQSTAALDAALRAACAQAAEDQLTLQSAIAELMNDQSSHSMELRVFNHAQAQATLASSRQLTVIWPVSLT